MSSCGEGPTNTGTMDKDPLSPRACMRERWASFSDAIGRARAKPRSRVIICGESPLDADGQEYVDELRAPVSAPGLYTSRLFSRDNSSKEVRGRIHQIWNVGKSLASTSLRIFDRATGAVRHRPQGERGYLEGVPAGSQGQAIRSMTGRAGYALHGSSSFPHRDEVTPARAIPRIPPSMRPAITAAARRVARPGSPHWPCTQDDDDRTARRQLAAHR